jgi:zinc transport system substrate-binding protein
MSLISIKTSFTPILRSLLLVVLLLAQNISVQAQSDLDENAKPVILATIKPIQLILVAIGGRYVQVDVLLPPLVSPHLYQLKPSDRQRLDSADLLVWIGPEMERFLVKPLSLVDDSRIFTLLENMTMKNDHDGHADGHKAGHDHGIDPHIWLSPAKALVIAKRAAQHLSALLPQHQKTFEKNLSRFGQQLSVVDEGLKLAFSQMDAKPYLVLHDGYQHFEQYYGIKRAAALTLSPDRKPGAKHLWGIQKQIDQGVIGCVFTEPQYQPAILTSIIGDTIINTEVLDPMAMEVDVSQQAYVEFIKSFGQSFIRCVM